MLEAFPAVAETESVGPAGEGLALRLPLLHSLGLEVPAAAEALPAELPLLLGLWLRLPLGELLALTLLLSLELPALLKELLLLALLQWLTETVGRTVGPALLLPPPPPPPAPARGLRLLLAEASSTELLALTEASCWLPLMQAELLLLA